MIRWKAVIPTLVLVVVFSLLIVFFLDPFVKWAVVKGGESVFGARVNVASANLSLRRSALRIRGMQVADKSEPMKNLFQFDQADFDIRTLPLLEKKIVIDNASLTGLKFGTARKTSGALPWVEKKPGFVGKAADRLWSQVETISLEKFEGIKKYTDPKTVINPDQLKTYRVAQEAKETLQKTPAELQQRIDQLNAAKRAEEFQKRSQALGQGGSDPASILKKAKEVQALQAELQSFKNDVATAQKDITGRLQSAQGLLEEVKKAKEEDWNQLRSTLSLPSLDKKAMASAVFGPTAVQSIERVLGYVHTARRYMPAKPQAPPPPPRGQGRTIEFPRENVLPGFLLVKAVLSGEIGQEQPFGFSGSLSGITTNPPLYGKPALIELRGAQGAKSFEGTAILNHVRSQPVETFKASYAGFPLSNLSFGQPDSLALSLKQGVGRARGVIVIQDEGIQGEAELEGTHLSLEPRIDLKSSSVIAQRATHNLTTSLSSVKSLRADVRLSGTLTSPDMDIDSNIGTVVAEALKKAVGAEVEAQEKALRAELDKQTQAKIQELQGMVNDLSQKYLPQLASQNKIIDDLLTQVKNKALKPGAGANPLDSFKGLLGR